MGFGRAERKKKITSPDNYYIEKCLKRGSLSVFLLHGVWYYRDKLKINYFVQYQLYRAISFFCEVLLRP